ncbi:DddA-like double-stranded DNA deaminase toxin, partial [Streptomyces shenzhenensis]|uniref:DddA-like double-stranded DNA deaminase toxin n=1 Tax=Streptomyces shenzhenensis TaxID=943815 RepID=UPI0038255C48
QIEAFHATGQFEAGLDDMKVDAARLAETGGPSVSEAAKAALADGTGKALATFLQVGQYGESVTDEKVITARLAETGGPEVQSAAKIALAGPPQLVHEFVTVGQYMAQRKDDLATHHIHQVQRLIAEGSLVAAKAQTDAWHAAEAAAKARNAADEAAAAALEAQKSAKQAAQHAADADASADDAEHSAADAAASAATARNAANRADADATAAEDSAAAAEFSAAYARQSATDASRSADAARAEALAAGKSAKEAEAAAKDAWKYTLDLYEREMEEALRQAEEERKANEPDSKIFCFSYTIPYYGYRIGDCSPDFGPYIDAAKDPRTWADIAYDMSGLADIKACIDDPAAINCSVAVLGVTPWGKLKLLSKIDNAVDALKAGRTVRRTVACLTSAGAETFSTASSDDPACPIWLLGIVNGMPSVISAGRRTAGVVRLPDGKLVPGLPSDLGLLISGEQDEWFTIANKLLYESRHPLYPQHPGVKYRSASHVETKYAAWMQTQNDLKEVTVVINNNNGVCDTKAATQNCMDAVKIILYDDQCMNVFYPGSRTGKRICGTRTR